MDDLISQDLLGLVCEIDPNLCLKINNMQSFEIIFIYLESIIIINIRCGHVIRDFESEAKTR